jgi:predicted transcriptional regulator of viral defense system
VFTLATFRREAAKHGVSAGAVATRLRHALKQGDLTLVANGVYAAVPPGITARAFKPDRFLVATALRQDAVLAYHSALELLGLAHSTYRDVYYLASQRRRDVTLSDGRVKAVLPPKSLRDTRNERFGVEVRERQGVKLNVTGPERTLVDCCAMPKYAGGLEEVVEAWRAVPALDLDRLKTYLDLLDQRRLVAILGFFLEQHAIRLFVPATLLDALARKRPGSKVYLDRHQRGGRLVARWNLIVPQRWLQTA